MIKLFFLLIILIEVFFYLRMKKEIPLKDGLLGISIALMTSYGDLFIKPVMNIVFMWVNGYKLLEMSSWSFTGQVLVLYLMYEFMYYWEHRLRHTYRFLWLEHVVHHEVKHVNFMTGLQRSWMSAFTGAWLVWTIFYFIGFNPMHIQMVLLYSQIYRFLLHTELIPSLGFLEYIFQTPSSHRVHHGLNDAYYNKNYGSSLALFDLMFGTFQKELPHEKPIYGTRNMSNSYNPVVVVMHEWVSYFVDVKNEVRKFFVRFSSIP